MILRSPVIDSAIRRCEAQADVGVNLPWAFFMMGKFNLLLEKPHESLECYAKAVELSLSPWMIDSALSSLKRLRNVAGKPEYAQVQAKLRAQMDQWMRDTADPRALGETDFWDKCPYVAPARKPVKKRR